VSNEHNRDEKERVIISVGGKRREKKRTKGGCRKKNEEMGIESKKVGESKNEGNVD